MSAISLGSRPYVSHPTYADIIHMHSRIKKGMSRRELSERSSGTHTPSFRAYEKSRCEEVLGAGQDRNSASCNAFLGLPMKAVPCAPSSSPGRVPRIYHATGSSSSPSHLVRANALANPSYRLHYANDSAADAYIRARCGEDVHKSFRCIRAPAYRADLFRFCALVSEGGVYLDGDLALLQPLEETYSPCATATVGHDFPWGGVPGKQMKIVAGVPRAPLFQCMLERIVGHVRRRAPFPIGTLAFSGPALLHRCFEDVPHDDMAITYRDTRGALWPWSGMRNDTHVFAHEVGIASKGTHYASKEFASLGMYLPECTLTGL
jgi:mannosyltransferase OCH1-like enzyme